MTRKGATSMSVLDINDLVVDFHTDDGLVQAIDHLHLTVRAGEIVGLVGESGCGKSTVARCILGVPPRPPAQIRAGEVRFQGQDLLHAPEAALTARVRGKAITFIPQDPVQATILNLFQELKERFALTYVFIAHDLGIIRLMCDRVPVMYLGTVVETGPTEAIFDAPAHPHTQALLAAGPGTEVGVWEGALLQGEPPRPGALPSGCRFRLRCPYAKDDPCAQHEPALAELRPGQHVACHRVPRAAVAAPGHAEQHAEGTGA
jgi:oligopeptide/dipeptide ABC transporter ATP-binding protein